MRISTIIVVLHVGCPLCDKNRTPHQRPDQAIVGLGRSSCRSALPGKADQMSHRIKVSAS